MAMAIIGLMAAAVTHYLYGGIRLSASSDRISGAAQVHISVLLGVFVLAKAGDYWLDRFDLVTGSGSLFTGMGYTDDNAVLPAKEILTGIALICAVLFFLNIWRRTWMLPSLGIALFALSAILLGLIVPGVVQQFQVSPNVPDKEGPYIAENIAATRAAFDLDEIEVESYSSEPNTTDGDLDTFDEATSSVPLVDPKVVSQTFEQQQQVRAYYSVPDVLDVDRYEIDGKDRAVVLGVRELDQAGIADGDKTWSNLHTVYTHGNGVIAAFANQRPEDDERQSTNVQWAEGQEVDESSLTELSPDGYESRVYYGEKSPTYSIVGKQSGGGDLELDLPKGERGDENQTTTYDGDGGVPIGSLFDKVLYAVKFGEPNLVLSDRVHENSKILYDRDPRTMVEKVAPWLTVDSDPYPAVVDGSIKWVLDGYTVTDKFPLSRARVAGGHDGRLAGRGPRVPDPADRRDQLHAQLGQGDRRRLRRHGDALRVGVRPHLRGLGRGLPRHPPAARGHPRRAPRAPALPRRPVQGAALPVRQVPRDGPQAVARRLDPVGGADGPRGGDPPAAAVPALPRRDLGADQRLRAARPGQPRLVRLGQQRRDLETTTARSRCSSCPTSAPTVPVRSPTSSARTRTCARSCSASPRAASTPSPATCSRCRWATG